VLNEVLAAARGLWSGDPTSYHGNYVNFDEMVCQPHPENVDDIRIWFGGKFTPRLIRRVVELGHGWIPFQGYGESLQEIGTRVGTLRQAMAAAERDPNDLDIAYWMRTRDRPLEAVLEDIPAMTAAGVTVGEFLFAPYVSQVSEVPRFLERFARGLEPYQR
jgi:hypothetical protein